MTQKKKIKVETATEENHTETHGVEESESIATATDESRTVEELEGKLQETETQAQEYYDRFLRVSADFENYKKRAQREIEEFRKYANESLIKDLLNVIDNLERAIDHSGEERNEDQIAAGLDLTVKELHKILNKFHVKTILSLGKPFDPNFHQAMLHKEDDDHPENTVIEEMQKGYLMHDRLLRPAMVVVSKTKDVTGQDTDDDA